MGTLRSGIALAISCRTSGLDGAAAGGDGLTEAARGEARVAAIVGGEALPPDLADALLARGGRLRAQGPTASGRFRPLWQHFAGDDFVAIGRG